MKEHVDQILFKSSTELKTIWDYTDDVRPFLNMTAKAVLSLYGGDLGRNIPDTGFSQDGYLFQVTTLVKNNYKYFVVMGAVSVSRSGLSEKRTA